MSTVVLSNAATATQTGVSLTFTPEALRTGVYVVKVVNRTTHAVIATLTNANADWIEQILNDVWQAEFHMHPLDPQAAELAPALLVEREVQIWRDGRCLFWGIPVQGRASLQRVTFSCVGLLWYYARRYFGPIQNNYLLNPDFESGLTSWTGSNTTATVSTAWRALGTQSVKLVQTSAGQDGYLYQRVTVTTTDQEVFYAVKALCHVSGTDWVGPAFGERGLYIEQQSTPGGAAIDATADPPTAYSPRWEPITESTQKDHSRPVRLETGIFVPAGVTRTLEIRLYSPGGTIHWDATALVVEESVGSQVTGDPAHTIVERIHNYSQDATQGKSDEDILLDKAAGDTTRLVRIYQFFDNANILEAMKEYPAAGLLDFEIEWPPYTGAERKLMIYPGTKGTHKAGSPITLGTNVVEDFSYDVDGTVITTSARVLGQGEGADREIGLAVDTSELDGLVLESVASAPVDSPIDSLQRLADEDLTDSKAPVKVPEFTVPAEYVIPALSLGDTVPVSANYGWVQESSNRRVIRLRIDCAADKVAVGVN